MLVQILSKTLIFTLKSLLQGVGKSPTLGLEVQGCETENSENQEETTNPHN